MATKTKKSKKQSTTVLPRDLKVKFGNDRLIDIRLELTRLKREKFPNAGAVLLRVFFELTVLHYLERIEELPKIIEKLGGKGKLPYGTPTMKQLVPAIIKLAKEKLDASDANKVEKANRDTWAKQLDQQIEMWLEEERRRTREK